MAERSNSFAETDAIKKIALPSVRLDPLPFSTERRLPSALQKGFRVELPKNLDKQGDNTGPTRLVAGPDAGAIVTMKVFVEQFRQWESV